MDHLNSLHFLSLGRPDLSVGPPAGVPDTSTLAAHDFDVDTRTGFMPPQPPVCRLPDEWEQWEATLDDAIAQKLKLGDSLEIPTDDAKRSETWRNRVQNLPIIAVTGLETSEVLLRRAHLVLAWIMHFYIHTLPPNTPVHIPPPLTIPLLQVCSELQLPPVLTYSDNVLYNWAPKSGQAISDIPSLDNLRCHTLFTGTIDEQEFYLTAARIELRGVEALELMQATMDEAFVGDSIAIRRITTFLQRLSVVIDDLKDLLLSVKQCCNPEVFYNEVRPWLRGIDSAPEARTWVFEGLEQYPSLQAPTELSGPSAGQSALIHALDIFLGVCEFSHSNLPTNPSLPTGDKPAFLSRMQSYMPRHHRSFLNHLLSNPRPLRGIVRAADDTGLLEAYNNAVLALKGFRDAHMIIVALYIIGPARRATSQAVIGGDALSSGDRSEGDWRLKGTGGTELVRFLKDVRDRTADALLPL